MKNMKNVNGESGITQLLLGMNFFNTSGKLIYYIFIVHSYIIFIYSIIEFCLQLVWIIVHRLCDNVCSLKR